jgi:predicted metalloprotease with PDZ domain
VIASVNEKTPGGYIDFIQELGRNGDRRELVLGVQRDGARQTARVRLVKKSGVFNAALIKQKLGLSVQDITPDLAEQMGLLTQDGLLVAGVDRESPAAAAGLQRGLVILGVDSGPAEDVATTAKVLYGKKKGDKVSLQILAQQRRGNFVIPRQGKVELDVR